MSLYLEFLKTFLSYTYYLSEPVWHYGLSFFSPLSGCGLPEDSDYVLTIFASLEATQSMLLRSASQKKTTEKGPSPTGLYRGELSMKRLWTFSSESGRRVLSLASCVRIGNCISFSVLQGK